MSNPFDQFATDFQAALPPGAPGAAQPPQDSFTFAPPPASPAKPPQPVMNAPPQPFGGYGGYGAQPPYGQPPQQQAPPPPMQQQPMMQGYGQPPFGGPPFQPPPQPSSAPPPPAAGGDPFSSFGQAQPPASAPPTAANVGSDNPFASMPAGPPPPPPPTDTSTPFGAGGAADPWGSSTNAAPAPPAPAQEFGSPPHPYGGPTQPPPPPPQQEFGSPQHPYGSGPPPAQPSLGVPPQGQQQQLTPPHPYGGGAPPSQQSPNPFGQTDFGAPPSNPYGAPPPAQPEFGGAAPNNPYGAPPPGQPAPSPFDPSASGGALVVSQQQSNPYAQAPVHNPYGQPPQGPYGQQPNPYGQYQQPAPPPPAPVDPFSVFESSTPAPAAPNSDPFGAGPVSTAMVPGAAEPAAATVSDDEFWGSLAPPEPNPTNEPQGERVASTDAGATSSEEKKGDEGLPEGGEYYDARIFTPTLGVMFFKPQELTDSLFLNTDRNLVDALGERPVVAFIVEGSSARSAGVELGHVLLKVNGQDVRNPKEASRLIKEGPRPLPLLFYVPNTDVVVAEGEHMVKYDTRETTAPSSAKDWKPKYVVIGGIIAQPWMMNMYRSKSEYDIAVIETQARRPVSVKVKQFSLQGARIQNDWQGPQMVKYKNKLHPWKYIVVLPVARNPIKISSPNLSQLKPVHEGIRRVLLAQQRSRGPANTAAPVRERDPYSNSQSGGGGDYSQRSSGGDYSQRGQSNYAQTSSPPAYAQQGGYAPQQQQQSAYGY